MDQATDVACGLGGTISEPGSLPSACVRLAQRTRGGGCVTPPQGHTWSSSTATSCTRATRAFSTEVELRPRKNVAKAPQPRCAGLPLGAGVGNSKPQSGRPKSQFFERRLTPEVSKNLSMFTVAMESSLFKIFSITSCHP